MKSSVLFGCGTREALRSARFVSREHRDFLSPNTDAFPRDESSPDSNGGFIGLPVESLRLGEVMEDAAIPGVFRKIAEL